MIKFAVRGLLARKLRTVLTAIGVVLGVALVLGTYVLTDSISTAFDSIFTRDLQEHRRRDHGQAGIFSGRPRKRARTAHRSFDASPAQAKVTALPEVNAAVGQVRVMHI